MCMCQKSETKLIKSTIKWNIQVFHHYRTMGLVSNISLLNVNVYVLLSGVHHIFARTQRLLKPIFNNNDVFFFCMRSLADWDIYEVPHLLTLVPARIVFLLLSFQPEITIYSQRLFWLHAFCDWVLGLYCTPT